MNPNSAPIVYRLSKLLIQWVLVFVLYFTLTKIGLIWATTKGVVSPVSPAAGLGLVAVLVGGYSMGFPILIATFLAILDTPYSIWTQIVLSCSNAIESIVVGWFLRWIGSHLVFQEIQDVVRFVSGVVLGSLIGAGIGSSAIILLGNQPTSIWGDIALTWWMGDTLGMLILVPLLFSWFLQETKDRSTIDWISMVGCVVVVCGITWLIFFQSKGLALAYLTFPLLIWSGISFGQKGVTLALVSMGIIGIWGTTLGFGPFDRESTNQNIIAFQQFLGVMSVMTLILAAIVSERQQALKALKQSHEKLENRVLERTEQLRQVNENLEKQVEERTTKLTEANRSLQLSLRQQEQDAFALQESESRFRTLVENAPEAIVVLDLDLGIFVDFNDHACRLFEMSPEELRSRGPLELSPPFQPDGSSSVEKGKQKLAEALSGIIPRFEWVHRNTSGKDIPCEVYLVRLPSETRKLIRGSMIDISDRKRIEKREQDRRNVLEQLAKGQPLSTILDSIVALVEEESPESLCSILLLDSTSKRLLHGSAPRLPEEYNRAVHGAEIGLGVGSCGTAAFLGQRIIVEDIFTHPYWIPYRDLANAAGVRACWSEPIRSSAGKILGTFAIYHTTPQIPTSLELDLIEISAHLASIAIERTQNIEEIRESRRILQLVLDNIPLGVFWKDRQSRYLGCNRVVAQAFGFAHPDQIIGKCDHDLPSLKPEQADFFVQKDREVMESNTPELGIIEPATLANGISIWMETNKMPMQDFNGKVIGVLGTWQDITARKQAEEGLRQSEERVRLILESSLDAVITIDDTGKVTGWNPQAKLIFGWDRSEAIDHPLAELIIPERFRESHRRGLKHFLASGEGPVLNKLLELTGVRRDGTEFPVEITISPLRIGKQFEFSGFVRDISERKRNEEERRKLEAKLQHSQKLESLGVLAGGIAHDFNNLLTSILGYTDLALLELPSNSSAHDLIVEAVNGTRRAAELTKQMLAYSGKGRFVVEPVNLSLLAGDMARLLEVSISKKCILKFHCDPNLPTIEADAAQIRQITMNLIINASEAIGDNNGIIVVATGMMCCDRNYLSEAYLDPNLKEGNYVYLEVTDTGCGMSEETRSKIFDPFFTTKFTGRGLGLSAVLGIVRGHKGALKVYTELNKGTTFRVLFPATELPTKFVEKPIVTDPVWRGSGTVLVVDDEESVRGIASQMLSTMGFQVLTANDGREAVEIFRSHSNEIDLVLLDMTMPHLDGKDTFLQMRNIQPQVKAILSSGYNEQTATSQLVGKGLGAFLQKPYRFEDLQAVVRKVLEK
jgi:PAS domain S-box-containing protein